METTELLRILQRVGRVHQGSEDHFEQLRVFAQELNQKTAVQPLQPLLLSGWSRWGVYHGGYEYTEGPEREKLQEAERLFWTIIPDEKIENRTYSRITKSTRIEAWRRKQPDGTGTEIIFLVLEIENYVGTVGIDNHHGSDTTWEVKNIRVIPV